MLNLPDELCIFISIRNNICTGSDCDTVSQIVWQVPRRRGGMDKKPYPEAERYDLQTISPGYSGQSLLAHWQRNIERMVAFLSSSNEKSPQNF